MADSKGVVVISGAGGHTVISKESLLKRLHYFDGKFLRATDLNLEQQAMLTQVRLSNQAGGAGIVHGYSCSLTGDGSLTVDGGLAIDPEGRALHLAEEVTVGIADLIEKSRQQAVSEAKNWTATGSTSEFIGCASPVEEVSPDTVPESAKLYLVTVGHAEAYCGEEDVYGNLCESACISSTERPYVVEGVVLRAIPLKLALPSLLSQYRSLDYLRSRAASAFFAKEQGKPGSCLADDGLSSYIWCRGAEIGSGDAVPLAVIAREGAKIVFLDAWMARRERMGAPARQYWAGRMAMRPWNVFLAQVLQFQCQLAECYKKKTGFSPGFFLHEMEPQVIKEAMELTELVRDQYEVIAASLADSLATRSVTNDKIISLPKLPKLELLNDNLVAIKEIKAANPSLINRGIVELPSTGYLPVSPASSLTVNQQIRQMMGNGVDLRFCAVRPDYIPHAFEEAQHMERISLLEGLNKKSAAKPKVDVLVPDGVLKPQHVPQKGRLYSINLNISNILIDSVKKYPTSYYPKPENVVAEKSSLFFYGTGRGESLSGGGMSFCYAGEEPRRRLMLSGEAFRRTALERLNNIPSIFSEREMEAPVDVPNSLTPAEAIREASISGTQPDGLNASENEDTVENGTEGIYSMYPGNITMASPSLSRAVWVSFKIDKDPFSVSIGNECFIQAELIFHDSSTKNIQTIAIRTTPDFRLKIKGPVRTSGPKNMKVVQAALMGTVTLERIDKTGKKKNTTISINNSVKLQQGQQDALLSTIVSLLKPSMFEYFSSIQVNRTWTEVDHAQVKINLIKRLSGELGGASRPVERVVYYHENATPSMLLTAGDILTSEDINLITAKQTVNDEVARPDHPAHEASLRALEILTTALKDRSFASSRAQMLFPPIPADQPAYVIQATHDWVLFHRRRNKPCHADSPVSPELRRRGYRVYLVHIQEPDSREALLNHINAGNIDSSFHPKMISYVEFDATTSVLRNGLDSLLPAWETAVANTLGGELEGEIVYRAIANGNEWEDGEALTLSRLNQLTNIVDDEVTKLAVNVVPNILPGIPLGLNGLREDEGVVLFAVAPVV
ncbi:MAG: hypothetical protein QTN59_04215 [Candidatus Electrothrix communis]|nr:MAG: hypothetical protein QTN59_04215 [Candidatus Electrothrix communis]